MGIMCMDASNIITARVGSSGSIDFADDGRKVTPPANTNKNTNKDNIPFMSEKAISDSLDMANKVIAQSNRHFEYSVHKATKEIVIKVVDSETNEVIREIPPEKILDLIANLMQLAGLLVDERR